jgi:hypothetical protein
MGKVNQAVLAVLVVGFLIMLATMEEHAACMNFGCEECRGWFWNWHESLSQRAQYVVGFGFLFSPMALLMWFSGENKTK